MKNRIFLFLPGLFVLCITPCDLFGMDSKAMTPVNAETVANEIALAEASMKRAAEAGSEWLATGSLIEQARQAVKIEDWQQALVLAREANQQGELAVEQAERESIAWRDRVIQ